MEVLDEAQSQKLSKLGVAKLALGIGAFAVGAIGMELSTLLYTSQNLYSINHAVGNGDKLFNYWINFNSEFTAANALLAASGVATMLSGLKDSK